jgi:hypothetical protein
MFLLFFDRISQNLSNYSRKVDNSFSFDEYTTKRNSPVNAKPIPPIKPSVLLLTTSKMMPAPNIDIPMNVFEMVVNKPNTKPCLSLGVSFITIESKHVLQMPDTKEMEIYIIKAMNAK